jgi:subtilase family serine protease
MKNGFRSKLAGVICTAIIFLSAGPAPAAEQILSGHRPAAAASLSSIGVLPAASRMNLAIGLPLRNQAALNSLLQQIYDTASPNYRHYLTPAQFTEKFGPSPDDYQSILDFARTNGLTVTSTFSNRMVLGVSGAVSDVEKAFHVTMQVYQHPSENRTFYAPDVEPSVDARLPILHVQGMNNYALPRPLLHKVPAGARPGEWHLARTAVTWGRIFGMPISPTPP